MPMDKRKSRLHCCIIDILFELQCMLQLIVSQQARCLKFNTLQHQNECIQYMTNLSFKLRVILYSLFVFCFFETKGNLTPLKNKYTKVTQ
jgi:hypothetical protein